MTAVRQHDGSLPDRKTATLSRMVAARQKLLVRHPFIGSLALRLELIPTKDSRIESATTDGQRIFADIDYFDSLSEDEQMAIIAHEVWHCAMRHFLRRGDRDPLRFNYACDVETDLILLQDGFSIDILPYDEEWKGQCAEWIYERVPAFLARFETKDMHIYPQKNIPGPPMPEDVTGHDKSKDDSQDNDSQEGSDSDDDANSKGRPKDDDDHEGSEGESNEFLKPQLPQLNGNGDADEDFSPDFENGLDEDWQEIVADETHKHKERGTLPGFMEEALMPADNSTVDWRKQLQDYVTMMFGGEQQWIPPNRRFVHKKLYLPSRQRKQAISIVLAIDTSGSTMDMLQNFLDELAGLADSFGDYSITVIQCDERITDVQVFDNDNPIGNAKFTFKGLGGTNLIPPFIYATNEMPEPPNVLIYLTDGFGPAPTYEPPYPVIWCLTPDGEKPTTWGLEIHLPENDDASY